MVALGALQTDLFAQGLPTLSKSLATTRFHLDDQSWIDLARGWLMGADHLLTQLASDLQWRAGRRPMYGTLVDEPRLHASLVHGHPTTPAVVAEMSTQLEQAYGAGLSPGFVNYYRDGNDSVAWHADRIALHEVDPVVAIVSLGYPRRFGLRPIDGGPTTRFILGSGDLLVMGGACQHQWHHSVPKMRVAGPRMSISFRHVVDDGSSNWWQQKPSGTAARV